MAKYKMAQADRPDKADIKLLRDFTAKKTALQKAVNTVKLPKAMHMFQTTPDGFPLVGVSSNQAFHVNWHCRVEDKNLPIGGCTPLDLIMVVITRLQYLQATELNYPKNYEALLHLYNAAVILSETTGKPEELGLVDIHKAYA